MTLEQFAAQRQKLWQEASELIVRFEETSLRGIPENEMQRLSFLYRLLCSDLAFARSHYSGLGVTFFLNALVGRCHPYLYQRQGFRWRNIRRFFAEEYPALCRAHARLFGSVAAVFTVSVLLGVALAYMVPEWETLFLSPEMVEGLKAGRLWTESIFAVLPSSVASARILTNNISVTFFAFALGVSVIGTLYVLLMNGVMLGTILGVCYQYNMMAAILSFVSAHGFIEITAILISATSGLLIGIGWMDPGDLSRGDSTRKNSAQAVRLVLGMAPVLMIAGLIEGFFSPRPDFPVWSKLAVGLVLLALLLFYCFWSRPTSATERHSS